MSLILASQSPRRKELLSQLGYTFTCQPADIDESVKAGETPAQYVVRLAIEKARHIATNLATEQRNTTVVLGSDTTVVMNNNILGKPESVEHCQKMLSMLSGSVHQVLTAIAVVKGDIVQSLLIDTDVTFKRLTTQEILNYWQTGEPQDKAGSYGIQGIGGQFIKEIKGSYSAVVGLPLYETTLLLERVGLASPLSQGE